MRVRCLGWEFEGTPREIVGQLCRLSVVKEGRLAYKLGVKRRIYLSRGRRIRVWNDLAFLLDLADTGHIEIGGE